MKRRELFSKILGAKDKTPKTIPPPYFSGSFNECMKCQAECINSCDRELLSYENNAIKFKIKELGCNFCESCANACANAEKSVISLENRAFIQAKTSINTNSCLAWNDTICYNCQDACRYGAIDFFGMFRPMINSRCVNCGECLYVCFKNSIKMEAL